MLTGRLGLPKMFLAISIGAGGKRSIFPGYDAGIGSETIGYILEDSVCM